MEIRWKHIRKTSITVSSTSKLQNICVKNNVWQSVQHDFLEVIECSKIRLFRTGQSRDMFSMNIFVLVAVKLIKISVFAFPQSKSRILSEPPVQFLPLPFPLLKVKCALDRCYYCLLPHSNHQYLSPRQPRSLQQASYYLPPFPCTLF